ncbi:MAG: heme exporter protein CcmD [Rhizobacter sp.]
MNWGSSAEFFRMGGYGLYVWGAYAVTALLMAAEPWLVARRRRRAFEQAREMAQPEPAR